MVGQPAGKSKHQTAPPWSWNIWCRGSTKRMITDNVWHLQELESVSSRKPRAWVQQLRAHTGGGGLDPPQISQMQGSKSRGCLGCSQVSVDLNFPLLKSGIKGPQAPKAERRAGVRSSATPGVSHISTHTSGQRCYHPSLSETTWHFLDSFLVQNHSVNAEL